MSRGGRIKGAALLRILVLAPPHCKKLLTPLMSIRFFFSKLFLIKLSNYFEIHIFFKVKVEPTFIIEFDLFGKPSSGGHNKLA